MPTYQYACTECDHRFEAVQAFSDASLTVCPVCGGKLRKVFSSVGIVFKGSGFYRNDSRAGAGSTVKAESGSDKSSADKSGDKSTSTEKKGEGGSTEKKSEKKAEPAKAKGTPAAAAS